MKYEVGAQQMFWSASKWSNKLSGVNKACKQVFLSGKQRWEIFRVEEWDKDVSQGIWWAKREQSVRTILKRSKGKT